MTISPDTPSNPRPDPERTIITEREYSQRPEETSSRSKGEKVAWVVFLILFGLAGVYLIVTLFSVGLEVLSNGTPDQQAHEQQRQESAPPTPAPSSGQE